MCNTNFQKGRDYETFVFGVYKAILAYGKDDNLQTLEIERNKKITSHDNTNAEIDIYWEVKHAGITFRVAIECKNYKRNVQIKEVRDFANKIQLQSGLKGLIVTQKGFSGEAIEKAKANGIDLVKINPITDQNRSQYCLEINMYCDLPAKILNGRIEIKINKEWGIKNGLKKKKYHFNQSLNANTFIENKQSNFKYSLKELEENLFFEKKSVGIHTWNKNFKNGWISINGQEIKIDQIKLQYQVFDFITRKIIIDYSSVILAIKESIDKKRHIIHVSGKEIEV